MFLLKRKKKKEKEKKEVIPSKEDLYKEEEQKKYEERVEHLRKKSEEIRDIYGEPSLVGLPEHILANEKYKDFREKKNEALTNVPEHSKYPVKLIISTDIGSDIDDALAFLQCLHFPKEHVDLLGVITEFGHVGIRQVVTQTVRDDYNESNPSRKRNFPVFAGDNEPIYTIRNFMWHTGYEGIGCVEKEELEKVKANPFTYNKKEDAVDFLIQTIHEHEKGEITLLCIGSLLNVAKSFRKDSSIIEKINRIVFMGLGVVAHSRPPPKEYIFGHVETITHTNHNCRQDMGGAIEVFRSGVPIICVGHTVTHQFWWEQETTQEIRKMKSEYKEVNRTGALLEVWLGHRSSIFYNPVDGTCPHDTLTLTEAIYPNSFLRFVRGDIVISPSDEYSFIFNPKEGNHYVAVMIKGGGKSKTDNDFCDFLSLCLKKPMEEKEVNDFLEKVKKNEKEKLTNARKQNENEKEDN